MSARVGATISAREELNALRVRDGEQVVLLSWPSGATVLPASVFTPTNYDVILTHVAACPVFADIRQLAADHDSAVLDARSNLPGRRPLMRLLPDRN